MLLLQRTNRASVPPLTAAKPPRPLQQLSSSSTTHPSEDLSHLGGSHERHKLECLDTLDLTWLRPSGTLLSCAVICALAPVGLALAPAVTLAVTLAQAPAATLALAVALAVGLVVALRSVCSALEVCAEAAAHMAILGLS